MGHPLVGGRTGLRGAVTRCGRCRRGIRGGWCLVGIIKDRLAGERWRVRRDTATSRPRVWVVVLRWIDLATQDRDSASGVRQLLTGGTPMPVRWQRGVRGTRAGSGEGCGRHDGEEAHRQRCGDEPSLDHPSGRCHDGLPI